MHRALRAVAVAVGSLASLAACHAVGTLRGDPSPPAPRKAAAGKGVRVRVASYNVWGLPLGFSKELESRMRRLPEALRALDPDVVCLQEVWPGSEARTTISAALAGDYAAAASDRGGLMVLSRYPIVEERFVPYPTPPSLSAVERLARKGVLEVVVKTPGGPLRVVTTHMVAFDSKVRDLGVPVLAEVLAGRPEVPLIAAGDFNVRRLTGNQQALSAAYQRLLDTGCSDCAPPVLLEDGTYAELENSHIGWPRREGDDGWWRPDHILFRSGADVTLRLVSTGMHLDTPETALSDHNLLLADLRLVRR